VLGANASSFFRPDFSQARNKTLDGFDILKINLLNVFLAKIALHF